VAELCEFAVQIFVNSVEPFLKLLFGQLADRVVGRVVVNVWEQNGL
jgi:hypothetical protein